MAAGGPATVRRRIAAPAADVWEVLADGWSFATWVVGACRIRSVDAAWPGKGAAIHHSVGAWPVLLNDDTRVQAVTPGRELVLEARVRPFGTATVRIELASEGPDVTAVTMQEDASGGPGLLVPGPLRRLALLPRNVESLRRLDLLAVGRSAS